MKKGKRKNPHAMAQGRLGGLVQSEAKKRANKENGRKAAWSRAARRPRRRGAIPGGHVLGVARSHQSPDPIHLCAL
jgi:hypothetical protein